MLCERRGIYRDDQWFQQDGGHSSHFQWRQSAMAKLTIWKSFHQVWNWMGRTCATPTPWFISLGYVKYNIIRTIPRWFPNWRGQLQPIPVEKGTHVIDFCAPISSVLTTPCGTSRAYFVKGVKKDSSTPGHEKSCTVKLMCIKYGVATYQYHLHMEYKSLIWSDISDLVVPIRMIFLR